jgi:hypothetical protein
MNTGRCCRIVNKFTFGLIAVTGLADGGAVRSESPTLTLVPSVRVPAIVAQAHGQASPSGASEALGLLLFLGVPLALIFVGVYRFYVRPRLQRDARNAGTPQPLPSIRRQDAVLIPTFIWIGSYCVSESFTAAPGPERMVLQAASVAAFAFLFRRIYLVSARLKTRGQQAQNDSVASPAETPSSEAPPVAPAPLQPVAAHTGASSPKTPIDSNGSNSWQQFFRHSFMAGGVVLFVLGFAPALAIQWPMFMGEERVSAFDELCAAFKKGDGAGVAIFTTLLLTPLWLTWCAARARKKSVFVFGGILGLIGLCLSVSTHRLPVPVYAYQPTLLAFQIASAGLVMGFFVKPELLPTNK